MVKFETITGREITLDLAPDSTVRKMKEDLARGNQWNLQKIHLLFDGSELNDDQKLSKINLENGKRFIVIYVEPDGNVPDVEGMINILVDFQPDRKKCLEALQKFQYNIEQASDYLLNQIVDAEPPPAPNPNTQAHNSSKPSDGKEVKPSPNNFQYTSPKTNKHGLTEDEEKFIKNEIPKDWDFDTACELFIDAGKNKEAFKSSIKALLS